MSTYDPNKLYVNNNDDPSMASYGDPSLASHGMGSIYESSHPDGVSHADGGASAEVSTNDCPSSLQPTTRDSFPPKDKNNVRRKKFSISRRNNRFNPSLPELKHDGPGTAKYWKCLTWMCTAIIPDCFICRPDEGSRQAWREKMTIFQIFLIANIIFLFFFGVIPLYFCRVDNPLQQYAWYEAIIDETCNAMGYASFGIIFAVLVLLALQCLCSLLVGCQSFQYCMSDDRPSPNEYKNPVMVMIPCYNEGDKELAKTINSVLHASYPEEHKVLLVIDDGIITGRGEDFNTPTILASLLGFTFDSKRDETYAYKSVGGTSENRASIYSGVCQRDGKYLKYVVIVKCGMPEEEASARPGNRGKRDSQLIALGLLNRIHHNRKQSDLDKALCTAFDELGMPIADVEYMLALDADTRISVESIVHMVYNMNDKPKVLACCGETKVENKATSWVTMIQVYEYFASHHLKKSFESVFGCVTCLPGCFTMYRMTADDGRAFISSDSMFQHYARNNIESLHEKNLYHLGEDRMLTSLLLEFFPDMNLAFVPMASCWTIVPDSFKVLLSQRRRWVNSTFHNMWELLKVNTMCGFCCISMKNVVLIDMICTLILPSSIIYALAYTYTAVADGDVSNVTIVLYTILLGTQVLLFVMRSRFDHTFWFVVYLFLGIPVFYFILPIYSFWHMDDFSWGTTRQVSDEDATVEERVGATDAAVIVASVLQKSATGSQCRPPLEEEQHRTILQAMDTGPNVYRRGKLSLKTQYSTSRSSDSSVESTNHPISTHKSTTSKAASQNVQPIDTVSFFNAKISRMKNKRGGSVGDLVLDAIDLEGNLHAPKQPVLQQRRRSCPAASHCHNQHTLPGEVDDSDNLSDLFADFEDYRIFWT